MNTTHDEWNVEPQSGDDMLHTKRFLTCISLVALAACGGDGTPEDAAIDRGRPEATDARAEESAAAVAEGTVSFQVDGRPVELDFLPDDANYYMRAAAAVLAKRDRDEPEQFMLIFMSTDLRAHDIPGEFPPEGVGSSIQTAMQSVAFSYIDSAGQEWAGPGRVHVESFTDDGVLTATFDAVTLPHTDRELPDITLTDGRVRATL